MTSTKTPAQIKTNYVRLMGPQAGEAFAELMQDAARLHLKWNEFLALFAASLAQIDTLNKAAPGFFYLVSEASSCEFADVQARPHALRPSRREIVRRSTARSSHSASLVRVAAHGLDRPAAPPGARNYMMASG